MARYHLAKHAMVSTIALRNSFTGQNLMLSFNLSQFRNIVPDGYATIPLTETFVNSPLRLCILVHKTPVAAGGPFVLLRDTFDARIYLGLMADAIGRPVQWLEIWLQTVQDLSGLSASAAETVNNMVLAERWSRRVKAMEGMDGTMIATGWETTPPPPLLVDLPRLQPVHPVDEDAKQPWSLCRDDALLTKAGLPAYSTSIFRYLYIPQLGEGSPLQATCAEAPLGDTARPLAALTTARPGLVCLNAACGQIMVRPFVPQGFEDFVNELGAAAPCPLTHGREVITLNKSDDDSSPGATDAWLHLGRHGRLALMLEAFHLKLRLLADAVASVHALVAATQQPLLNLSPDSFRVQTGPAGRGMPSLWCFRAIMVKPGDAIDVAVGNSDQRYYLPARAAASSIYQPLAINHMASGRCTIRIRKVNEASGQTSLEGTLATQERITASPNDLVRLWLGTGGQHACVYARLESQNALAVGEWRFNTVPQQLETPLVAAFHGAQGIAQGDVRFEFLPLLTTAVDMYSLAVLGARVLLVQPQTTLPVVLDELLSLAGQLAQEQDRSRPLSQRIGALFSGSDPRWMASLGPQRLLAEEMEATQVFAAIPPQLWWDALAILVKMLPGAGPDSLCTDYGHAPPKAMHKIFDPVLAELDELLIATRSLIVVDWQYNREIRALLDGLATTFHEPVTPAPVASAPVAPARVAPAPFGPRRMPPPGRQM